MRAQINHARRHATFDTKALKQAGYRQIGIGSFSRVFVHPDAPDVVIKVGSRIARSRAMKYIQDAFPFYAQQILNRTTHSKFYPKIYDLRYSGNDFLCIMKRYDKLPKSRRIVDTIRQTAQCVTNQQPFGRYGPDLRRFGRALRPFKGFIFDIHSGNVMQDRDGTPILIDPIVQ